MGTRIELHEKLCEILGSQNVYFQPPTNLEIKYPCIVYERVGDLTRYANNGLYYFMWQYKVIYINRIGVDDELWPWDPYNFEANDRSDKAPLLELLRFPYCSMDTPYTADNLYHYPFTLYF